MLDKLEFPTDSKTETQRVHERYQKAQALREKGINPYPYSFAPTHTAKQIGEITLKPEQKSGTIVTLAGRIMTLRRMGKAAFSHIQDQTGKVQFYIRKDDVGENIFDIFTHCELGDIVGITGEVFATKTGEISVYVQELTLLTKALRDLPDKFHGLKDTELRYRQRYVDLLTNTSVRDVFIKRSKIIQAIREFMDQKGFIEVETPLLQTQYGGAAARPFSTHINAWDMQMYLSISPELYLKRLLVGGFEKVYTICKNFRNEGVDHSHNPEFTMLEAYAAYWDYTDMSKLTEELYEYVAKKVLQTTKVTVYVREKGQTKQVEIDLKAPWQKKTLAQALKDQTGIDILPMNLEQIQEACKKNAIEPMPTWGGCALELFDELVEHTIVSPTHVIDRPREATPLCKEHRDDARLIEQNEPIAAGMELANMYSELNEPVTQRFLLQEQAQQLRGGDDEAHPMDDDFAKAVEYGMPPAGGLGIGIDRLVMLLLGQAALRDVILFPTVKPVIKEEEKEKKTN
ncbi:MAG: lysine--tRNA ligase [Candidatus Woesearchaeota archaeon]